MNDEIREFLMSRRALITPSQAGLTASHGDRRVPGLRRDEVAQLARVSIDYYTRVERGKVRGVTDSVLNAIAQALQLSDVERQYLFDLARPTSAGHPRKALPIAGTVRASVQRLLDNLAVPAVAYNARQDMIASNLPGRALFSMHFESEHPNMARFIFLDSRAQSFYGDWPQACSLTAAMMRLEAGRDPLDAELTALIGELSTRSPHFRQHWAARDVHEHRTGRKELHHPDVGHLDLSYDVLEIPGEKDLSITAYSAEESSPTTEKLSLLVSLAAACETQISRLDSEAERPEESFNPMHDNAIEGYRPP